MRLYVNLAMSVPITAPMTIAAKRAIASSVRMFIVSSRLERDSRSLCPREGTGAHSIQPTNLSNNLTPTKQPTILLTSNLLLTTHYLSVVCCVVLSLCLSCVSVCCCLPVPGVCAVSAWCVACLVSPHPASSARACASSCPVCPLYPRHLAAFLPISRVNRASSGEAGAFAGLSSPRRLQLVWLYEPAAARERFAD